MPKVLEVKIPASDGILACMRECPNTFDHVKRTARIELGMQLIDYLLAHPAARIVVVAEECPGPWLGVDLRPPEMRESGRPLGIRDVEVVAGPAWVYRVSVDDGDGDPTIAGGPGAQAAGCSFASFRATREMYAAKTARLEYERTLAKPSILPALVRQLLAVCAPWRTAAGWRNPTHAESCAMAESLSALEREVGA